jgi:eukaryotic-like serine/threonine-protein kinase
MGDVYLAEDTRLGRKVALKMLPASYQYDAERRSRFLKEARTASALRSPNIAAIYDIGEHLGAMFIVMEYVEGELLSRKISREPLPVSEALGIAAQIADALDEAHQINIIHRDVKSSNIIVTDRGLAKVLDFGIAKVIGGAPNESDDSPSLSQKTAEGVVLGTVSYMSPEQARGLEVDSRTDIFSLGVVLYEMITGQRPFEAPTTGDTLVAILHREPRRLSGNVIESAPELQMIIDKALNKDRERRYQSVSQMRGDLRSLKQRIDTSSGLTRPMLRDADDQETLPIESATIELKSADRPHQSPITVHAPSSAEYIVNVARQHKRGLAFSLIVILTAAIGMVYFATHTRTIDSIAVLPLTNMTGNQETEYLSDGLTESIINSLSRLPNLKVMSQASIQRYKSQEIDAQSVAKQLGVAGILTGRVMQRGEDLSVSVELIDARDNNHVWGARFNRKLADLMLVEEDISQEIANNLRVSITGADRRQLIRRDTENSEAYQLYLKGRYYWNKRTEDGLKKGIANFEKAISIDGNYALAYSGLADCYELLGGYGELAPADAMPKAKEAAQMALHINDSLAEAHASLAQILWQYDWNWSEAEQQYKRAIELKPDYPTAHQWYGEYLATMGRFDESIAQMKRASELDPFSLIINTNLGWVQYFARRYDEAIAQYRSALELDPNFLSAHVKLVWAYEQEKMLDKAMTELQWRLNLSGDRQLSDAVAEAYRTSGYVAAQKKILESLKLQVRERYVSAYDIAKYSVAVGDHEQAFEWLERAYRERNGWLVYLNVEPAWDPVRSDRRFDELLRRVGFH